MFLYFYLQCHPCWFTCFSSSYVPKPSQTCLSHLIHNVCHSTSSPNFLVPDHVPSTCSQHPSQHSHLSPTQKVLSFSPPAQHSAPYISTGLSLWSCAAYTSASWHFPVTHHPCDLSSFGPRHFNSLFHRFCCSTLHCYLCTQVHKISLHLFQFHSYSIHYLYFCIVIPFYYQHFWFLCVHL